MTAMRSLLDALQELLPDSSKTKLRQLLQHDQVLVNGKPERSAKRELAARDCVEIAGKSSRLDSRLRLLFEDADILVVEKPEGLLTVPAEKGRAENTEALLNVYLGARHGEMRAFHVHRLDYDTSGVLVFAKNAFAHARLQEQFARHTIDRRYIALVRGKMTPEKGTLRAFLAEGADLRVRLVADPAQGKEAITHYRTLDAGPRVSRLELTLETGRRHQIRVQLSHAGHPVLGDAMYDKDGPNPLRRLALHAKHLAFAHPRSGKKLAFTVEPPQTFLDAKL